MNEATLKKIARPLILLATVIWGSSFVVLKNALEDLPVFSVLAVRFLSSALLLALIFRGRLARLSRDCLKGGAVMGLLLLAAYSAQTFGLKYTTPGKNAFLTAAYCVIVPFLSWRISKARPDRYNVAAALLCVAGIGLVSLDGGLSMGVGDLLSLLSSLFYAAHILAVSRYAQQHDVLALTVLQFAVVGVGSALLALPLERLPAGISPGTAGGLLYLSLVATAGALLFQNVGQRHTEPAAASVLLSLEAPFGVVFSLLFYGEVPTGQMMLGFALIFVAVLCSETKFAFLRRAGEQEAQQCEEEERAPTP